MDQHELHEKSLEESVTQLKELLPDDAKISRKLLDTILEEANESGMVPVEAVVGALFSAVMDLDVKMSGGKSNPSIPVIRVPITLYGKTYYVQPKGSRG